MAVPSSSFPFSGKIFFFWGVGQTSFKQMENEQAGAAEGLAGVLTSRGWNLSLRARIQTGWGKQFTNLLKVGLGYIKLLISPCLHIKHDNHELKYVQCDSTNE